MARGRESGDVRGGRAGRQRCVRSSGQPEQLQHPTTCDALERAAERRQRRHPRLLIPGRGQPLRGYGHGIRTADHQSEEARSRRRDRRGRTGLVEEPEYLGRVTGTRGQRLIELSEPRQSFLRRHDVAVRQAVQVGDCSIRCITQEVRTTLRASRHSVASSRG